MAALQGERATLDAAAQELASAAAALDGWLANNEKALAVASAAAAGAGGSGGSSEGAADGAAAAPPQLDPDAVIEAADPLSQQALEAQVWKGGDSSVEVPQGIGCTPAVLRTALAAVEAPGVLGVAPAGAVQGSVLALWASLAPARPSRALRSAAGAVSGTGR